MKLIKTEEHNEFCKMIGANLKRVRTEKIRSNMRSLDEIIEDIKTVLEEKVEPNVAAHNGSIGFINFASDTGVATLKLSGSCSGCAMSKLTLQQGVERLLKHYVPEVNSIVGEDDEKAAEQGYKPFIPRDERDV